MKKIQLAIIIFIMLLCGLTTYSLGRSIQINGANEVVGGEENIITVQIENDEKIGVIQGFISYDSNIRDVKITSSYNGWTATYNEATGKFNAFNAEGTTNGEVLKITYKLSENAKQGSITLKDVELTTISYNTIKIEESINKTIINQIEDNEQNENDNNPNRDEEQEENNNLDKNENEEINSNFNEDINSDEGKLIDITTKQSDIRR